MFAFKAGAKLKFYSSTLMMTLLWLALFRCLRKHQLPTHLRPTISVEQLLSFLCHNNSHSVDTDCQPCKISHTKQEACLPSFPLSVFHTLSWIYECMRRGNTPSTFMLYVSASLPSWSKPDIKVTHSFPSLWNWMETVLHFQLLVDPLQ